MCQKCTFSGDTFYYPSIIFNVCSFEIFVTPTEEKKKKKHCRKEVSEEHRAVVRKTSLDSESHGGCGRREENAENTGLGVQTLGFRNQVGHLRVT